MGKNRAGLAEAIQLLVNNIQQLGAEMTELKLAVRANTLQMHAQTPAKEEKPPAAKKVT